MAKAHLGQAHLGQAHLERVQPTRSKKVHTKNGLVKSSPAPFSVPEVRVTEILGSYPENIFWPVADNPGTDHNNPLSPNIRQFIKAKNLPQHWVGPFLQDFAENGLLMHAIEVSGTTRDVVMIHRRQNVIFAHAYEDAALRSSEKLEMAARERALEYSDPLMMFLLKGTNPDKFGDKVSVRTESQIKDRVTDLASRFDLDPDELIDLATEILEKWDPLNTAEDVTPAVEG